MTMTTPPCRTTRRIAVWDLPVRLFHWTLAALVAGLLVTGETGKLGLHLLLGAAPLALVLFRLGWGMAGSRTARFTDFVRGPGGILAYLRGETPPRAGHNPLGALSVLALLTLVAAQAVSGLFTSDDILTDGPLVWLASSSTVKAASAWHSIGSKVLMAAVALHLAAILWYRLSKKHDLVRPMITGRDEMPDTVPANTGGHPLAALLLAAASAAVVWGGLAVYGG